LIGVIVGPENIILVELISVTVTVTVSVGQGGGGGSGGGDAEETVTGGGVHPIFFN
jgi:hypothetical protein